MKTYNKLIRDNIPSIIEADGNRYKMHVASDEEYMIALKAKLREETLEFSEEPSVEELADILEVIDSLKSYYGFSDEDIEAVKSKKHSERGGFDKRLILEWVDHV